MKKFIDKSSENMPDKWGMISIITKTLASCLLLGLLLFGSALVLSCAKEEGKPRTIRAHTSLIQGIPHAEPSMKAERYCQECHGLNLSGGKDSFEPSCYTCHGKNWMDDDPTLSLAPSTHTVQNGKYFHHSSLTSPIGLCEECHGSNLEGTGKLGTPGCELCHAKKW